MDDLIANTGVAYRALANPAFMDNALRQLGSIRDRGVFTGTTAADRKGPLVATRDIADTAVELLSDRSWTGANSVAMLGPEDLSPNDMARIMSEVLGRSIGYERQTLEQMATALSSYGRGEAFVQGMVETMRAKEEGVDDGMERTTTMARGTTFAQWCAEVLSPALQAGE